LAIKRGQRAREEGTSAEKKRAAKRKGISSPVKGVVPGGVSQTVESSGNRKSVGSKNLTKKREGDKGAIWKIILFIGSRIFLSLGEKRPRKWAARRKQTYMASKKHTPEKEFLGSPDPFHPKLHLRRNGGWAWRHPQSAEGWGGTTRKQRKRPLGYE